MRKIYFLILIGLPLLLFSQMIPKNVKKVGNITTLHQNVHPDLLSQFSNGDLLLAASVFNDTPQKIELIRMTKEGFVIWKKNYDSVEDHYLLHTVIDSNDMIYLITEPNDYTTSDHISKIDKDGNLIFTKKYASTDSTYYIMGIDLSSDNHIYISGSYGSDDNVDSGYYFAKVKNDGNIVWQKKINVDDDNYALKTMETSDNGFIVLRGIESDDSQESFIEKYDSQRVLVKSVKVNVKGGNNTTIYLSDGIVNKNDDVVIVGEDYSENFGLAFFQKYNSNLDLIQNSIIDSGVEGYVEISQVFGLGNEEYMLINDLYLSGFSNYKISEDSDAALLFGVIKADGTLGEKYIFYGSDLPTNNSSNIIKLSGNQYMLVNTSFDDNSSFDLYSISDALKVQNINKNSVNIYPNPTKDIVNLESQSSILSIELFSISGRLMKSQKTREKYFDMSGFENGIYIMKITTESGINQIKLIKE